MINNLDKANRSKFTWKNNKLYVSGEDTGYKVFPSGPENKFWKIEWPDGEISSDFYNLTRAKENTIQLLRQDGSE